jgi:hypothetical protein
MRLLFLSLLFILPWQPLPGRTWRNATGESQFEATYLSNDGKLVTLRRNGRILTFAIDKLHPDDREWLRTNHPPANRQGSGKDDPPPSPMVEGAAFDTLSFGDTRPEVIAKLQDSTVVESSVPEAMLARVGLNGSYRTKKAIGQLHCHLYFDWNDDGKLKEVTLRTKPRSGASYTGMLRQTWDELIKLLTILHGPSVQHASYPDSSDLQDGLILNSHLWHTEEKHSVLLGTGQEGSGYSVVVRITSDHIKPNPIQ